MKTKLFLLLLVICLVLTSCSFPFGSTTTSTAEVTRPMIDNQAMADSLEYSLENYAEDVNSTYVVDWLNYYGLAGLFTYYKIQALEQVYHSYYIGEIPDPKTVSRRVVEWVILGLRQDAFDYQIEEELTDFLASAYLVSVGDKYGTYFNKENFKYFQLESSGSYVGVGVSASFNLVENTLQILSVIPGAPAEDAGILAGDYITHVDGVSVAEMGYYLSMENIRGEEGTTVTLTILRGEESFDVTIKRAPFTVETVYHRIIGEGDNKIGYILLTDFSEVTVEQFKAAVDELEAAGVKGLVFDLRNNGGGLLSVALEILDYLLPDGEPLIQCVYYDGSSETEKGSDRHHVNLPFTVLTNSYSASASEIFAAALKDYAAKGLIEATLVGELTFGKGMMQALIEFADDTAVTISVGTFDPPYSPSYHDVGITPDVSVLLPEEHQGKNPQLIPEA